jgi:hypothetical protein
VATFVAVIVKFPVFPMVTLCEARTPAVNFAVESPPAVIVPEEVILTRSVKVVKVALFDRCAVIRMANGTPAFCRAMLPVPTASTLK